MKYIQIAVVSIFVGMIIACGGGGVQFAGTQDVVDSFDEFDFQDCEGGLFAQMVGANSGIRCEVEQRTVEIYTFDGDAEALCNKLEFCRDVSQWGATKVYLENVMLVVYDGVDFGNALIADLQK
jgi:hypothetical protein